MPSISLSIKRSLENQTVSYSSELSEVIGIGPYLSNRLARALKRSNPVTIGQFWSSTQNMDATSLEKMLGRALQNTRGNQCVSTRVVSDGERNKYHTEDINRMGYEACVALLDYRRRNGSVRYRRLPVSLPKRSKSASRCGCKSREECRGPCALTSDGLCVPRHVNTKGFVGVSHYPHQKEVGRTLVQRRRVKQRSYARSSRALFSDPDSSKDIRDGHSRKIQYSQRGNHMWRHPSPKVRLPIS